MPLHYSRKQTLKGAERYITPELKSFEDKVLSAREKSLAFEKALYDELLASLAASLERFTAMRRRLGRTGCAGEFRRTRRDA